MKQLRAATGKREIHIVLCYGADARPKVLKDKENEQRIYDESTPARKDVT